MRLLFDRGTILVLDPPAGLDLAELPGVLWDPRVQAHRAPARCYLALTADLGRRGVRVSDAVRPAGREPDAWSPIDLRPYQDAALCAWGLADRRGLVVLPTGSGKTRVAMAAMARTRLATLCLVPTRVLLEQWLRELGKVYGGTIGCYGDGVRELAPVTVATFESAYRHMDRLGNRFDLLVVDEAHHFGCGVRDEAIEMSIAGARLGLTATPPRDDAAAARLVELVGPTVYELAIGDLAGRFLASFDLITLHLDLTGAERSAYERGGLRDRPGAPDHADDLRHRSQGARRGARALSRGRASSPGIRQSAQRGARRSRCGRRDHRRRRARRAGARAACRPVAETS